MKLIIDADPIVYRVGFASETRNYDVIGEDAMGKLHQAYFEPEDGLTANKRAAKWLDENDLTLFDKTPVVVPDPIEHALHSVRVQMESIVSEVTARIDGDPAVVCVLSGPGNYRERIATVRPYKGNRDPEHKPFHYQSIRNYLTSRFNARVVHGREADDEVSILARREESVIATIDKDLDQVPGLHYDYAKKVFYTVADDEAERFFWIQALAGDGTDNIPGCPGFGLKKAARLIDATLSLDASPLEVWGAILAAYMSKGLGPEIALETARLVYMQREPGELWTPPGSPKEWLKTEVE